MAGTYEQASLGEPNSSAGPKWLAQFKGMNEKLNSSNKLEDSGLASPNNEAYRTIFLGGPCAEVAGVTNTRYFGEAGKALINGASNLVLAFWFAKADYEVANKTQKLRLRVQVATNGTSFGGITLTVGMYPVSATSGEIYTLGSVVSGSTVAFASTLSNKIESKTSGDFTIPSDGLHVFGVATDGETIAGSSTKFNFQLQTRSV